MRHSRQLTSVLVVVLLAGCRDATRPAHVVTAPSFTATSDAPDEESGPVITIDHQVPHVSTVVANAPADPNGSPAHSHPATSASPDQAEAGVRRAVAGEAVLQKMTDAVANDNRTEFLDTIDPKATDFRGSARTIFSNLTTLPISTFQLRYVSDDAGALTPDRETQLGGTQSWLAQVR